MTTTSKHRVVLEGGPEDGREYDVSGTTPLPRIRLATLAGNRTPFATLPEPSDQVATEVLTYVLLIGPGGTPARSRTGSIRYRLERPDTSPPNDMTRHPPMT